MHTATARYHRELFAASESRHPDAGTRARARHDFTLMRADLDTEEVLAATGLTREEVSVISSPRASLDMTSERLHDVVARVARAAGFRI